MQLVRKSIHTNVYYESFDVTDKMLSDFKFELSKKNNFVDSSIQEIIVEHKEDLWDYLESLPASEIDKHEHEEGVDGYVEGISWDI